jgi:ferredoxin
MTTTLNNSSIDPAVEETELVEVSNPSPDLFIRTSTSSKLIIEYHRDMCIGAASCVDFAGRTFAMDDENKAIFATGIEVERDEENGKVIYRQEVDNDDNIMNAAYSCPTFAIVIKDKETGEQLFPPM